MRQRLAVLACLAALTAGACGAPPHQIESLRFSDSADSGVSSSHTDFYDTRFELGFAVHIHAHLEVLLDLLGSQNRGTPGPTGEAQKDTAAVPAPPSSDGFSLSNDVFIHEHVTPPTADASTTFGPGIYASDEKSGPNVLDAGRLLRGMRRRRCRDRLALLHCALTSHRSRALRRAARRAARCCDGSRRSVRTARAIRIRPQSRAATDRRTACPPGPEEDRA